jgi:hypothetical protein
LAAKRKVEVLPPGKPLMNSHHVSRLDTVGAIRREQAKIYRMAAKGQISSAEAARLIFCLREVRSSVESEPPIQSLRVGSVINVSSIAEGQQYAPGGKVLLPLQEADKAWKAWHGGAAAWKEYLGSILMMDSAAYQHLVSLQPSELESVPALEHLAEVVPLHCSDRVERFSEGALIDGYITEIGGEDGVAPEGPPDAVA